MKTLNIIGAGRVGRSLARLWREARSFGILDIATATATGARDAAKFIGAGRPVGAIGDMRPADAWVLTVPDGAIRPSCEALAASGRLRPGDMVFHVSGALSSAELKAAAAAGAATASVHPLKTFADAESAVRSFAGTYCAAEGAPGALAALKPAFEAIGARVFEIDPEQKTLYHAASVVACNYLTALMETALRLFEQAGFERATALAMMAPLVRETLDNVLALGPRRALTGPVARGDVAVVARHLEAIAPLDARTAALYRSLGAVALDLARSRGEADAAALERLRALLDPGG